MPLWPLAAYAAAVFVVASAMILLAHVLGERHEGKDTGLPFESGIASTGSGRVRVDVRYYLVAMFFVIFDLEAVFLFGWAVAARELGWAGYVEAMIFVAILLVALLYLRRSGGLDTRRDTRRFP